MSMKIAVPGFLILLSGCATMPTGPSVLVLPGTGKPFEQFQEDNAECQYWAAQQTGADPQPAAQRQAAADAAIGTLIGAGAGAAIARRTRMVRPRVSLTAEGLRRPRGLLRRASLGPVPPPQT